jgi:phage tail-like protein
MSYAAGRPTFRLLDRRVGWNDVVLDGDDWVEISPEPSSPDLTQWDDPGGIRLLLASGAPDAFTVTACQLLAALPPHRLAPGCGPGSWLLLTPHGNVLRRKVCTGCWRPLWHSDHLPEGLRDARALAANVERFTVVTPGGVQVWTIFGEAQVAAIALADAVRVAFFPCGDLLVACCAGAGPIVLHRFGPAGDTLGPPQTTTVAGPLDRLAVAVDEHLWLATGSDPGVRELWRGEWGHPLKGATAAHLAVSFPPTNLTRCAKEGFCLEETGPDGVPVTACSDWNGCPVPPAQVPPAPAPAWQRSGSITSGWIDSGIPRCRWHRIRVTADVPRGTGIEIAYVATDFNPKLPGSEAPADDDWQIGPAGALDLLMQQTTGRYLRVRLTLTGDGTATPVVRSVRLDFPRRTSLDRLPAVYRLTPEAEDFTERFLANFDASIEDLDAAIARFPSLFDSANVPAEVLPWLAGFLDVAFDPAWPEAKQRQIVQQLPALYKQRGTLDGLTQTFALVFDVTPALRELAPERPWGALAESRPNGAPRVQPGAQVGSVRLFGKARTRFRVGHSALGAAPLHTYGNPDLDPIMAEAYRFEVQVPRGAAIDVARMTALIESQKPAHTAATVRFGNDGFVVGVWSAVGIDTALAPLATSVLGTAGNVRLRRASVVAAGTPRGRLPLVVGVTAAVGIHTLLQ